MSARIRVENLAYEYPDTGKAVFRNISFQVKAGDVVSLLGPNGTGKSTLLKCLAGILPAGGGSVLLDGEDLRGMGAGAVASRMAYVPQTQVSPFPYPVKEIVMMGRAARLGLFASPGREDLGQTERALELVGMAKLADRPCTQISGGEWQLVLIARAIAQESGILLLDEPTSHLDLGNQMKILETINSLAASGFTLLVATHFPDHAFLTSNKAAVLKDGALTPVSDPDSVITEAMMARTYGVDVKIAEHRVLGGRKVLIPLLKNGKEYSYDY